MIYIGLRSLPIRYWDIVATDTNTSQSQKYEPNLPLCDPDFAHLKGQGNLSDDLLVEQYTTQRQRERWSKEEVTASFQSLFSDNSPKSNTCQQQLQQNTTLTSKEMRNSLFWSQI